MNKEQLESLLPQLEKYFETNSKEQIIKDLEDAGCLHMMEEVSDEEAERLLQAMNEEDEIL
jgi:Mg/Co/Ni transporter MgtE